MSFFESFDLEPLENFVVLKRRDPKDMTDGGIYIPDTAKRNDANMASVIAVGVGRLALDGSRIPVNLKVGDTVLIDSVTGFVLTLDGENYTIARDTEIIAVVRNKKPTLVD